MASYTLYDASVGVAKDALTALSAIIEKAESSPVAASIPAARIHEDMLPFSAQVFFLISNVHKLVARTTGAQPKDYENKYDTYDAMKGVIADVRAQLDTLDRDTVNKRAAEIVSVGLGPGKPEAPMQTWQYAHGWTTPNIYFHLVTAYDIARKEGVPLGKMDYLIPFLGQFLPQKA